MSLINAELLRNFTIGFGLGALAIVVNLASQMVHVL